MWPAAVLAISVPGVAAATAYSCDLTLAGEERQAEVLLETDADFGSPSAVWSLSLTGTHVDPDRMLRLRPMTRVIEGRKMEEWGETAFVFVDRVTVATLSIDYGMKSDLALHIAGPDRAYFEHYTGFCEASH